jgi:predicted glycogen debranching enzyme
VPATGRFDDAKKILRAFARSVDHGMLPNRFPDAAEAPEYNTVDATLWFFVAAHRYLEASDDAAFVIDELLPVLEDIVAWHERGTRYGIRVDATAASRGRAGVQLTWMDAKVGDWVVTPRQGKPVEIQALWYNALAILADLRKRAGTRRGGRGMAQRAKQVKERFTACSGTKPRLPLRRRDGDRVDASIRPNQIFALSLPYPLLAKDKAKAVLAWSREALTPVRPRSLSPDDPAYRGRYEGESAPPGRRVPPGHRVVVAARAVRRRSGQDPRRPRQGEGAQGARRIWCRTCARPGSGRSRRSSTATPLTPRAGVPRRRGASPKRCACGKAHACRSRSGLTSS